MNELTDPAKIKAATTYNAAADHFDNPALAFWNRFGSSTVNRLQLSPGAKVLDIASGTGASAIPAAIAVGADGKVIAVDLSANLLGLARLKAEALQLKNIEFLQADMNALGFPNESFNAIVCVFGIFFVPDMEGLTTKLWRMVKPGGKLAITSWGPHIFAPVYEVWRNSVKSVRPDLYSEFHPWDRITDVPSLTKLFTDSGIHNPEVEAENASQPLHKPDDWWTIALGSGLRWTIDQMGPELAEKVRIENLEWIEKNNITAIETNVIYAIATKPAK